VTWRSCGSLRFTSVQLDPGARLLDSVQWHALRESAPALVILGLDGSVVTPVGPVGPGEMAVVPPSVDIVGGAGGGSFGLLVRRELSAARLGAGWRNRPLLTWEDKYQARIGDLVALGAAAAGIDRGTAYFVETPADEGGVPMHVHRVLRNVVFVAGPPDRQVGFAIGMRSRAEPAFSMPIHGGDVVIVGAGVLHNLVACRGEPLRFFVYNDSVSDYENVATSDYHVEFRIPHSALTRLARETRGPVCIDVS